MMKYPQNINLKTHTSTITRKILATFLYSNFVAKEGYLICIKNEQNNSRILLLIKKLKIKYTQAITSFTTILHEFQQIFMFL